MIKAYIALGSNLQEPIRQISKALQELKQLPLTQVITASNFYENPPVGDINQPHFVNAVAMIETRLHPMELLAALHAIESSHQRQRTMINGPRTLDLDLLLYGNEQIATSDLQVPHPRMQTRSFVIFPLYELAPELVLPCGTAIKKLKSKLSGADLKLVLSKPLDYSDKAEVN